jgi:MFS family permease
MNTPEALATKRIHYAWIVAALTFFALVVAAGVRAVPGVLLIPLEEEFGWTRAMLSVAVSVNLVLYGLIGPFAAAILDSWGLRRTMTVSLSITALGVLSTIWMREPWQMVFLWGVVVGAGTGMTALVLAATVVSRWFSERRGLVMGMLTAGTATGQVLFLPLLAMLVERNGWRMAVLAVVGALLLIVPVIALWMRDRPRDVGQLAYGATSEAPQPARAGGNPAFAALSVLRSVAPSRDFQLLAGTFFICGASTVGLIGTHLIPAAHDHGIPETTAAGLLAMMGALDLMGTTTSGWLTDRWDSRKLLAWYYCLRGLSLLFLPFALTTPAPSLLIFGVFYGLDWIATVPPTVRLSTEHFGAERTGTVFGWIAASHQIGAAVAAFGAGFIRTSTGDYRMAFLASGTLCIVATVMALSISKKSTKAVQPAVSPVPALEGAD